MAWNSPNNNPPNSTNQTIKGFITTSTGVADASKVPITNSSGTLDTSLLPFKKGDTITPGDRPLISGLASYLTAYFNISNLGVSGTNASKVAKSTTFGPNNEIIGTLPDVTSGQNWPTIPDSGWTQCASFTDTAGDDISTSWAYSCDGYKYLKFQCTINGTYGGTAGTIYSYLVEVFPYISNLFSGNNSVILPKSGGILNNQASYDYYYNSNINPTYSFGWEGFKFQSTSVVSVLNLTASGCWGCSGTPGYGIVFAVNPASTGDEGGMCHLISQAGGSTGDSYRIFGKN
ncbi:hypothetical protein HZB04_02785 [Candidatus Wolfebacteria bacterium]|nr:hypothetical protein [Candidatus Wolfebacteria bacterium]